MTGLAILLRIQLFTVDHSRAVMSLARPCPGSGRTLRCILPSHIRGAHSRVLVLGCTTPPPIDCSLGGCDFKSSLCHWNDSLCLSVLLCGCISCDLRVESLMRRGILRRRLRASCSILIDTCKYVIDYIEIDACYRDVSRKVKSCKVKDVCNREARVEPRCE